MTVDQSNGLLFLHYLHFYCIFVTNFNRIFFASKKIYKYASKKLMEVSLLPVGNSFLTNRLYHFEKVI